MGVGKYNSEEACGLAGSRCLGGLGGPQCLAHPTVACLPLHCLLNGGSMLEVRAFTLTTHSAVNNNSHGEMMPQTPLICNTAMLHSYATQLCWWKESVGACSYSIPVYSIIMQSGQFGTVLLIWL